MATDTATFRISAETNLLGPAAKGLAPLLQGLRSGHSILTRLGAPVETRPEAQQWLYVQSSGSSGAPKTIRRHPESWSRSFDLTAQMFGVSERDTYAVLGDPGHSLTLFAVIEALHIGADLVVLSGLRPRSQLEQMAQAKVSVLYATPTQLRLMMAGAPDGPVLPDLRLLFIGGGFLDPDLRARLARALPLAEIRAFFGASETSFITMADAQTPQGSVGKAYPGVTLRVGAPFETAEIWVASPYLFDGYAAGDAPDTRWDGDFLSIGELGYLDEAGNLFLRGRTSRMVTVADQNVFPEEVETLLSQTPAVVQAVVLARPDAQRGHHLVAVIQARTLSPDLEQDLRRLCKTRLGAASTPRRFVFVEQIPLLPAGKPDLVALEHLI